MIPDWVPRKLIKLPPAVSKTRYMVGKFNMGTIKEAQILLVRKISKLLGQIPYSYSFKN